MTITPIEQPGEGSNIMESRKQLPGITVCRNYSARKKTANPLLSHVGSGEPPNNDDNPRGRVVP